MTLFNLAVPLLQIDYFVGSTYQLSGQHGDMRGRDGGGAGDCPQPAGVSSLSPASSRLSHIPVQDR